MQRSLRLAAVIAALASCGKRRDDEEPPRAPASADHALAAVAEVRTRTTLIAGTERIALWVGDAGWYEPSGGRLVARPELGAALARTRQELGGELVDVHLGLQPILSGGEEHREQVIRFGPGPQPVELAGALEQVVTAGGVELWRTERALRSELVAIDGRGAMVTLPGFALAGPPADAASPVSAKACAAPKVRELAGGGDAIVALITECAPAAPVRIATYRWPGPSVTITTLPALGELGFQIDHLAATRAGTPILVGRRGDVLVIGRLGGDGKLATTDGAAGIEAVAEVAVAGDGAVWTLAIGRTAGGRDLRLVARDGKPVRVASPGGGEPRPESLALDGQLGVVVLGRENGSHWLLAEHATGSPDVIAR